MTLLRSQAKETAARLMSDWQQGLGAPNLTPQFLSQFKPGLYEAEDRKRKQDVQSPHHHSDSALRLGLYGSPGVDDSKDSSVDLGLAAPESPSGGLVVKIRTKSGRYSPVFLLLLLA